MNRRSFLAGLLAATARCSFGLPLPKILEEVPPAIWTETCYGEVPLAWAALTEAINEMKQPNRFLERLLVNEPS